MSASYANRLKRASLRAFAAAVLCGMLAIGGLAQTAHADESADGQGADEGENVVNTQQLPDSSFIYDTSIAALSEADSYMDNQTVQVVGEVVGDNIRSGLSNRHRWITLTDESDSATVATYMTAEQASKIDSYGSYNTKGTTLQVRGTYHLVCADHDGISDLHAETVTVVKPGAHHEDEFDVNAFVPGLVTVAIGLLMLGVFYWMRERQR